MFLFPAYWQMFSFEQTQLPTAARGSCMNSEPLAVLFILSQGFCSLDNLIHIFLKMETKPTQMNKENS